MGKQPDVLDYAVAQKASSRFFRPSDPRRLHTYLLALGASYYILPLWIGNPDLVGFALLFSGGLFMSAFTCAPTVARQRFNIVVLLVLLILSVGYEKCPHASYLSWGQLGYMVTEGKECGNQRSPHPWLLYWMY